jgi:hypothetical protein
VISGAEMEAGCPIHHGLIVMSGVWESDPTCLCEGHGFPAWGKMPAFAKGTASQLEKKFR